MGNKHARWDNMELTNYNNVLTNDSLFWDTLLSIRDLVRKE